MNVSSDLKTSVVSYGKAYEEALSTMVAQEFQTSILGLIVAESTTFTTRHAIFLALKLIKGCENVYGKKGILYFHGFTGQASA